MPSTNIQPLRPFIEFVLENRQLTKEAYDFLYSIFIRVGGSLSNLDAASLLGSTWNSPGTIGATIPNTGKFTTLQTTGNITIGGDTVINTIGRGLQIKQGANARTGRATLVAGTVTVANTSVGANTNIYVFCLTPGGTPGWLQVSAVVNGTSFTILSSSLLDTSIVNWMLVEQI